MTEDDWPTATDPAAMLTLAVPRVPDRKLRLFLAGCCRRHWDLFLDERTRWAVAAAERVADGRAGEPERAHALTLAREAVEQAQWERAEAAPRRVARAAADAAWVACDAADDLRQLVRASAPPTLARPWAFRGPAGLAEAFAYQVALVDGGGPDRYDAALAAEWLALADLLRCVFGNPFVYTIPDPTWRTSAVLGLAHAVYADRAFDRLPILADALEEAGCDDPDVLTHCRRHREHARGCWVIDLLLDKS